MQTKLKYDIFSIFLILITAASSIYFYLHFPEQVPSHWNFKGEVDGYSSKGLGAFLVPGVLVCLYIMFLVLPKIDPKRDRYKQFIKPYKILQNLIILFLAIMYFATSFYAIGYNVNINILIPALIGLLFIVIGNYMSKLKSNWFVGIRTPWTLSSEEVWNKTHRMGGKVFIVGGILLIATAYVPAPINIYLFIANIVFMVFSPVIYSYIALKKERKSKNNENNV